MDTDLIHRTRAVMILEAQETINATLSGQDKPRDPAGWIAYWQRHIDDLQQGRADRTFYFRQRAHYLGTGECIPFLARV